MHQPFTLSYNTIIKDDSTISLPPAELLDVSELANIDQTESQNQSMSAKRRGEGLVYTLQETFTDENDAMEAIESENMWQRGRTNTGRDGVKKFFKCKFQAKSECTAGIYVWHDKFDDSFSIFRNQHQHVEHDEQRPIGICPFFKKRIEYHFERKITKPKSILHNLGSYSYFYLVIPILSTALIRSSLT